MGSISHGGHERGKRGDGDLTRARILESAGQLAAECGYANMTSKQVCERAHVNMAAVNYHFGSREGLYAAVLAEAHDRLFTLERLRQILAEGTAREKLSRTLDELLAWVDKYCEAVKPYISNTTAFLRDAQKAGKSILFEAQLGALRDLDYGIYPYTTSSNAVAAYAPVGSGLPTAKLDEVVGVVKAYSSCVGEGPFVCEWFGEDAQKLRDAGAEYGAKTGRPRRVGPIDLVATRYGVEVQGATNIALTKLDILSYMDKIPVCAHYELDGQQTDEFPFPVCLQDAKPVIEYVDGWKCDISKVRSWDELPENARNYVEYVERAIGCHIGYVSVGAERDSLIIR